jgi:ubiquinone biosynthesis protein Coq4
VRRDPTTTTADAAIVEIGFARSRLGRRFARWEDTLATLRRHPETARALRERWPFGPIDLRELEALPEGTLGRIFADHCRSRGLDPNLVYVPPTDEVGWLLNHFHQTHDIWHVVTGWGNDLLNVVSRRADLGEVFSAFTAGWRMGQSCDPLFGVAWDELWGVPLPEVRARFLCDRAEIVGEGIPAAA